jgi:hypothetical protein
MVHNKAHAEALIWESARLIAYLTLAPAGFIEFIVFLQGNSVAPQ